MDAKKMCRKCLLAELDNEKLMADVKKAIDLLEDSLRTPQQLYEKRLSICKECDYLNEGTCGACGCYVEIRAATKISKCPYKHW